MTKKKWQKRMGIVKSCWRIKLKKANSFLHQNKYCIFAFDLSSTVGGKKNRKQDKTMTNKELVLAHHHTYKDVTSLDHRILLEADFLVNSFEDHIAPEGIITFRNHVFRSESAIRMLNDMWGLE